MNSLHNLKSKILLFLFLVVAVMARAQQWEELQTGVAEDLYNVCCIDTNTVFACGRNGVILKTGDGGNSWEEKYRQEGYDWYAIKFLNPNIGFVLGISDVVGGNEKLFKTIDGGETWLDMGDPFNTYNYCSPSTCALFIVDSDTLYVACDQLMKSTDGGYSFSQMDTDIEATQELYFEGNLGYIVWGEPGVFTGTHVAKTTEYGASWEEILAFDYPEYGIEKAVFHDKDHVTLYGGFDDVGQTPDYVYNEIKTEDGFVTYQWLLNETIPTGGVAYPPITGMCYCDSQNGIAVYVWHDFSPNSAISTFQTQDGGNTWNELTTIECPYSEFAAIGGSDGIYYLALRNQVYKMKLTFEGISEKEEFVSVYPNPVPNMLYVSGREGSELILYDYLGRVLLQQKLTDEIQKIGLSSFPAGIYFLGIKAGERIVSVQKILKK